MLLHKTRRPTALQGMAFVEIDGEYLLLLESLPSGEDLVAVEMRSRLTCVIYIPE